MSVLIDGIHASALWPPHYTATFDPLVIFDESGRQIAKGGDALQIVVLGPTPIGPDSCGMQNQVQLFFGPDYGQSPGHS